MSNAFITLDNVSFTYPDEEVRDTPVLRHVSLSFRRGEYVAVLGHNGSGKSTLAKLLNMILEPTEGQILIDGQPIVGQSLREEEMITLRQKVGMVFQNPDNQLVATIVEEDVAFGPENLGVPSEQIRARVDNALATVGMSEYARHEPHRLSGGQKQRIAIAGILAMRPDCMILDESTAMLDPVGRREVMDTIEKLNREEGITVLTITHYMDEAVRADRVIVMNDGEVLLDGTPVEVFSQPDVLRRVGLDVPQCTDLIVRLRADGYDLAGDGIHPEECADMICRLLGKEG